MAQTTFIIGDSASEVVGGSTPLQVQVTIDDAGGVLTVSLDVLSGFVADLRGFFFDIDESLLSTLSVGGSSVVLEVDTDTDGIPEVSDAAPPNPEAEISPLAFFAGVEIGTGGIGGGDDFDQISFTIASSAGPLTLADLMGQHVGIRAQSVGDDREGSSKLHGYVPEEPDTGSITGFKYHDVDGDGTLDGGEQGEPNWTIELYNDVNGDGELDGGDTLVGSTTTGLDGSYSFTDLAPGDYIVREGDVPGWVHITPDALAVTLDADETAAGNNFFNALVGSITGHKYNDLNGNGSLDVGEEGIAGWTIMLYRDLDTDGVAAPGELVQTTQTGPGGTYSFAGVVPGSYLIVEETRAGWSATSPVQIADTQISAEHDVTDNDFFNREDDDPPPPPPGDNDFEKHIDVDIGVSVNLSTSISFEKDITVDIDVGADADVNGNLVSLGVDAEAYGQDTLVEVDSTVLSVEDRLSNAYLSIVSAA